MSIIDLLFSDNINILNQNINICEDKIVRTRNQLVRSTSSCRLWQFKLCTISYYFSKFNFEILSHDIIDELCRVIMLFLYERNNDTLLNQIIISNLPINNQLIQTIYELPDNIMNTQMYYMCIYNLDIHIGSILHFFTIIKHNGIYYLNSSYGSDFVCVPQYTQELNINEFNDFCDDLILKNDRLMDFVTKYFLRENLRKRYNNNTIEEINPSLKSKWIQPEEGIEKEISIFMSPFSNYRVGLIRDYENLVQEFIIKTLYQNGGKRKRRKRSKTKSKSKNRLSSYKNSKKKNKSK